jgi:hypothetical protein
MVLKEYQDRIFAIESENDFEQLCMEAFHYQARHVSVYSDFLKALNKAPASVTQSSQIPFLPIDCFRVHEVYDSGPKPELWFESSGTTDQIPSRHFVRRPELYDRSFMAAFERFVGKPEDMAILALLPSYMERPQASLLYMASELIRRSGHAASGFYPEANAQFLHQVHQIHTNQIPHLILGVSFALLDWAEQHPMPLPGLRIMETGGMKGRRKELVREALHQKLQQAFHVREVWSEYGMTEMLSQAYAKKEGYFECPPWMKLVLRDTGDPFLYGVVSGGINIIDLANIHSCCFIATQDLGRRHKKGQVEVLGRFDASELRGCNLMVR